MFKKLKAESAQGVSAHFPFERKFGAGFIALFVLAGLSTLKPVAASEPGDQIQSFDSQIKMSKNASIEVSETIVVDFAANKHHGIERYIPRSTRTHRDFGSCYPWVKAVQCDLKEAKYSTAKSGDRYSIRIGDPSKLLTGLHTYKIDYVVENALQPCKEGPELYWDPLGPGWQMPIKQVKVVLTPPEGTNCHATKFDVFTSVDGQEEDLKTSTEGNGLVWQASNLLPPYSGFNMICSLPENSVTKPGLLDNLKWKLEEAMENRVFVFFAGLGVLFSSAIAYSLHLKRRMHPWGEEDDPRNQQHAHGRHQSNHQDSDYTSSFDSYSGSSSDSGYSGSSDSGSSSGGGDTW